MPDEGGGVIYPGFPLHTFSTVDSSGERGANIKRTVPDLRTAVVHANHTYANGVAESMTKPGTRLKRTSGRG